MISISAEAKQKYIKDSQPKELEIGYTHKDIVDLTNVNLGLPTNHYLFNTDTWLETGVTSSGSTPIPLLSYVNVITDGFQPIPYRNIWFRMRFGIGFKQEQIMEQYRLPANETILKITYRDLDGRTFNILSYTNLLYQPYKGQAYFDYRWKATNGVSEIVSIEYTIYNSSAPTYTQDFSIRQLSYFVTPIGNIYNNNDYQFNSRKTLNSIPNFNADDYIFHVITKDNLEEENFSFTESLSSKDNLKYGLCEASVCEFTVVNYDGIEVGDIIYPKAYLKNVANSTIYYGVYIVRSIERTYEGSIEKKKITAYNKITELENKAKDWNTIYMYGAKTYTSDGRYSGRGFEFARQIFSSVFSALKFFGVDKLVNYVLRSINAVVPDSATVVYTDRWLEWTYYNVTYRLQYSTLVNTVPNPKRMYMVDYQNINGYTDDYIVDTYLTGYRSAVDSLGRGFGKGDIWVEETSTGGIKHRYMVDKGDLFAISANCASFKIYIPTVVRKYGSSPTTNILVAKANLYESNIETLELTNGAERLTYYNYYTTDIYPIKSDATGRDVVRSLLEMCGCFFSLDRQYGIPKYVYPDKSGLYPSNTLYPSNSLYPRASISDSYEMGRYETLRAEDYSVASIGKIQIVKKEESNDVASCAWEHVGSNAPNTYVIDDNVYYCSEEMEYDYDAMPDVNRVLTNLFFEITNNNYTPFKAVLIGLPWQECGDRINIETYNGNFETFIFRRKLKGIDLLKDTYEAKGDKITEGVNKYLYTQEEE